MDLCLIWKSALFNEFLENCTGNRGERGLEAQAPRISLLACVMVPQKLPCDSSPVSLSLEEEEAHVNFLGGEGSESDDDEATISGGSSDASDESWSERPRASNAVATTHRMDSSVSGAEEVQGVMTGTL